MRSYYRVMLGQGSAFAKIAVAGGFIGADLSIEEDLTGRLPDEWRAFNQMFIPIFLRKHPEKSKIAAGLACGALWTIAKGIQSGDIVLCPDGAGSYHVGEVTGDYLYVSGQPLCHRRPVHWFSKTILRTDMSPALKNSCGSIGTVSNVSGHGPEIEKLIEGVSMPKITVSDPEVEDPATFAMEKHLEEFLILNWAQTELGKDFDIYSEDGEPIGQQYQTDTGPVDVLAISKDKKRLLVVELKKGRASDSVVGQVLRYMGYVQEELAEAGQTVEGVIIALDDDQRIRRALAIVPSITFYRYQVNFKLVKAAGAR